MKGNNLLKYIFIIFIIVIITFSIYILYYKDKNSQNKNIQINKNIKVEEINELRLGVSNFDTINPLITSNKEVLNIDRLIFEPLMLVDEEYNISYCLAKECSKISDTSYVIQIDNNIKWSDDTNLTAKDIQFTIDRLKEGKSIYSYNVEKIISVEVLDTDKIKINLSEEIPFFEYNLTFPIMPNNYYIEEDFYKTEKIPIGTGMFYISEIKDNSIKLIKNEKWWNINNKNSKIDNIEIKIFSEIGELYNSFKLGNIDIFTTSNMNLEQYIGTIGYVKQEYKGRQYDYLAFNCQNTILQENAVRNAIYYAIDKNNILATLNDKSLTISDFPLDYGSYLYNKESIIEFDAEKAKSILIEAGWEYKNNRWLKNENHTIKKLDFTIIVDKTNERRILVAENLKTQLEQIGIKITIKKVSNSEYKNILENKNYEIILTGIYNSLSPDISTFFGSNNLENYYNEEINQLTNEIKNIKDNNLIYEKYSKIIEKYNSEHPFIGLYRNKLILVKNQNLVGKILPNNYHTYYGIEEWYRIK